MERNPFARRIEKNASAPETEEAIPVPEYWKERPAIPFSRDYTRFQVSVARELAAKTGKPLTDMLNEYGTLLHAYSWAGTPDYIENADTLSDDGLAEAIYEREAARAAKEAPVAYQEGNRYGCFMYHAHEDGGRVDIHFSNAEFDETGPLAKDKIDRRLRELHDVFAAIRKNVPDAKEVRGNSWLYNLEAYKRLFPESYLADPKPDTDPNSIATGRTWGQFADDKLELKQELADRFLENIRKLDVVTPETVMAALPLRPLTVRGPIQDFYEKYGVA